MRSAFQEIIVRTLALSAITSAVHARERFSEAEQRSEDEYDKHIVR